MNYNTIKRNFLRGLWNVSMVQVALRKGVITIEQFKELMGAGVEAGTITTTQYLDLVGEMYSA